MALLQTDRPPAARSRLVGLVVPGVAPLPILMFREFFVIYDRIEQSYDAQQAIKPYVIFMLLGSFAIFIGGFTGDRVSARQRRSKQIRPGPARGAQA